MNRTRVTLVAQVALAIHSLSTLSYGQTQKPAFQYELGDTRISIPSADEPRVTVFGPESIKLAAIRESFGLLFYLTKRATARST